MKLFSKKMASSLGVAGAALATVFAMNMPAHAATNYTPDAGAGDKVNFVGTSVTFSVTSTGQKVKCPTFNMAGDITNPGVSRLLGATAGSVPSLTAAGCTNSFFGPIAITPQSVWALAITGDEVAGVSPATISNIDAFVNMGNCKIYVVGSISGSFDEATQRFTPSSSALTIDSTVGRRPTGSLCTFLGYAPGGVMTVDAGSYFTNLPPAGSSAITITSP